MRYAVVIEKALANYSAYVPDLPGCVATGATEAEVVDLMAEAIELHLQGTIEDGEPLPESTVKAVEIAVREPQRSQAA